LRRDAEEAVRIRADTAEARQAVEEALRAAEDGAVKVRALEAEIAALESALRTARQVGRAALDAMAASQPAPVVLKIPDGWWQMIRRLLGLRSRRRPGLSRAAVSVSPASLGESLPARAAR